MASNKSKLKKMMKMAIIFLLFESNSIKSVKINSNQPSKFEDIDLSGSISDLASIFRNEATVKKE
jgi:hypothetical protein